MSPRLLVTGARGLLGGALVAEALRRGFQVQGVGRTSGEVAPGVPVVAADLGDSAAAEAVVLASGADVVVHGAATTDVDACEARPDEARRLHALGSEGIARGAKHSGARLLHVSTDAVFDVAGVAHVEEEDTTAKNVYTATKREGEERVLAVNPKALVVRTNFFGVRPGEPGTSLAEWGLKELLAGRTISGFTDVTFNPLWNGHLAATLLDLADADAAGLLHVGAPEPWTKFEFLRALAEAFGVSKERVAPACVVDRTGRAPRSRNTVLSARKAEAILGRRLPRVEEGIARLAEERADWVRPSGGARSPR